MLRKWLRGASISIIDEEASWYGYHCGTVNSDFVVPIICVGEVFAMSGFDI
jgi:hypothetical protein